MKRLLVPSAALLIATCGVIVAGELKSGLQVGDSAGAFNVLDCTGPNQGKKLCYR